MRTANITPQMRPAFRRTKLTIEVGRHSVRPKGGTPLNQAVAAGAARGSFHATGVTARAEMMDGSDVLMASANLRPWHDAEPHAPEIQRAIFPVTLYSSCTYLPSPPFGAAAKLREDFGLHVNAICLSEHVVAARHAAGESVAAVAWSAWLCDVRGPGI